MKVYNTLTRTKEEFVPIDDNTVRIYSCGPTVYGYAHIGNMRTYIFMDMLRRVLKHNGYKLKHVMNITDVGHLVSDEDEGEDKMLKGAKRENKTPWEIARFYTKAFLDDCAKLHIERPEIVPKATDHIGEMIEFVRELVDKGVAYETSDGIYFDISKFPGYGKLSRINLDDQQAGARVDVNTEKRHPADFAVWKKAPKEHIMQWPSPWGMGYPGWHIECSAMSRKYLGEYFDIHTGGVDHIPIHHENEIAQSESLTGKPAVKYWMHGEFMMVNNGKMSKSLGNVYTISDLEARGISPMAFRYFCLNAHYRNKLNFTDESIKAAVVACARFMDGVYAHKGAAASAEEVAQTALNDFFEAVSDDLNIPKALGIAWNLIKTVPASNDIYEALVKMDSILGLGVAEYVPAKENDENVELPAEIAEIAAQRAEARAAKNWALSDSLRDKLAELGYTVKDSKEGQKVEKA